MVQAGCTGGSILPSGLLYLDSGADGLVERREGMAKVPGRDALPCPRCLRLHPTALGAQVYCIRNNQCALVDDGYPADGLVWASLNGKGLPSAINGTPATIYRGWKTVPHAAR